MIFYSVSQENLKNNSSAIEPVALSNNARLIISYLFSKPFTQFYQSQRTISSFLGISMYAVRSALCELRDAGLLRWDHRFNNSNIYSFAKNKFDIKSRKTFASLLWTHLRLLKRKIDDFGEIALSYLIGKEPPDAKRNLDKYKVFIKDDYHGVTRVEGANYELLLQQDNPLFSSTITQIIKKRRRVDYEILQTINKTMPLTAHGMICLKKYPEAALHHLIKSLDLCMTRLDPFKYALWICEDYAKKNQLPVLRVQYENEQKALRIPFDDENFIDYERLEKPVKKEPQIAKHKVYGPRKQWTPEVYERKLRIPKPSPLLEDVAALERSQKQYLSLISDFL